MGLNVPKGIIKADANRILPSSEMFLHYGSVAAFSDYFRYVMIKKTNEMWIDADTICLSELFFEKEEYVFLEESPGIYNGTLLKMPSNSTLSKFLNKKSYILKNKNVAEKPLNLKSEKFWENWVYLGPKLLTEAVSILNLEDKAVPTTLASIIEISFEDPFDLLWNPLNKDLILSRAQEATCLTFFNSWIDQRGLDKNKILNGSAMHYFSNIFAKNKI